MRRLLTIFITLTIGIIMAQNKNLKIGDMAPDFTLEDQNNENHTLSDYYGKKIVIYFYPKDDTPGCTKEACSIRDNFDAFEDNGIIVFGISYDSPKSHKMFAEKYDLPFTLLSDIDKTIAVLPDVVKRLRLLSPLTPPDLIKQYNHLL